MAKTSDCKIKANAKALGFTAKAKPKAKNFIAACALQVFKPHALDLTPRCDHTEKVSHQVS